MVSHHNTRTYTETKQNISGINHRIAEQMQSILFLGQSETIRYELRSSCFNELALLLHIYGLSNKDSAEIAGNAILSGATKNEREDATVTIYEIVANLHGDKITPTQSEAGTFRMVKSLRKVTQ